VEAVLTNSLRTNASSGNPFTSQVQRPSQAGLLIDRRDRFGTRRDVDGEAGGLYDQRSAANSMVQISPREIVKCRTIMSDGMTAEIVQTTRRQRIEFRYRGPRHMLVVYEQGVRRDGTTFVEGLPRSNLRDLRKKLTFVPAGHEYHECQDLRSLSRVTYFYFDPAKMPVLSETAAADLAPRLYFENAALWDTTLKLTKLIESAGADNRLYLEALGTVLAHELARLDPGVAHAEPQIRGGLAGWQQRIVTDYIQEHLDQQISLATLAQLVRLSPYHFCRAFKQSFGIPPHRYHTSRRIEHAKTLLAKSAPSVTDIGLALGFSQTSSFTAAFRRATGFTPTGYYRSLG
jgi:AraC family transcriptional regulator